MIGKECMFLCNVKLMISDGYDILCDGKRINLVKSIYIGFYVWFVDNVIILKGVDIGFGLIIGINFMVIKLIG